MAKDLVNGQHGKWVMKRYQFHGWIEGEKVVEER